MPGQLDFFYFFGSGYEAVNWAAGRHPAQAFARDKPSPHHGGEGAY